MLLLIPSSSWIKIEMNVLKRLINRNLSSLILAALTPVILVESVEAGGRSDFYYTCRNIYITSNSVLVAECQRRDGSWQKTSLQLIGIHNEDGQLIYNRGAASFGSTCPVKNVEGDSIKAECIRRDGSKQATWLVLYSIANIDGNLTYTASPFP